MAAGLRQALSLATEKETHRHHEAKFLAALEIFLEEEVSRFEPEVRAYVSDCLGAGGKRIRPTLLSRTAFSGETEISPDLVKAASVIELVHVATLVHDDILDKAELRRSTNTLFSQHGSSVAVLVGDALFAHALKLAAEFPTTEVCYWVSDATRQTCAGEIQQSFHRGKLNLSLDDYFRVIELKTAELFRVSCLLGAFLGGFDDVFREAAATFGLHLGIAYQLYDDLADFFGDELCFGKTLGTDWGNRKPTLPMILLLQDLEPSTAHQLWHSKETQVSEISQMIVDHRLLDTCIEHVLKELLLAETALASFADFPSVPLLLEASSYIKNKSTELYT